MKINFMLHKLRKKSVFLYQKARVTVVYQIAKFFFQKRFKKNTLDLSSVGVHRAETKENSTLVLPPGYHKIMEKFYEEVLRRLSYSKNCIYKSNDQGVVKEVEKKASSVEHTFDITEVRDGKVAVLRLKDSAALPYLEEICSMLLPQLEEKIYGAPVYVAVVTVYRHSVSSLPEFSSILWHSDNHFDEELKVMVYLNEVTEQNAPFEYLHKKGTGEVIKIRASQPTKYPQGRIPQSVIDKYIAEGYESQKVTGGQFTTLVFNDKIIHKGNYAIRGYRDVLVL